MPDENVDHPIACNLYLVKYFAILKDLGLYIAEINRRLTEAFC